jgi:catechol 2,3-dioxygenase-like lactoylglutathione lyase family enzyme
MITGAHILLYSQDPDADRAFLRDVLGFPFVDVGHGWLIFALPAAEAAVHPAGGDKSSSGGSP